jgi:hypothetical protein
VRLPFRRSRAAPEPEAGYDPLDVATTLWRRLATGDASVWDELANVDAMLATAAPEQRTAFGVKVVETLQNLLSHPDAGVSPGDVRARLGPAAGRLWDELDAHWALVARWVVTHPSDQARPTAETAYSIKDPELALTVRSMYRAMPDGRFVGISDVARHALATGEAFAAS